MIVTDEKGRQAVAQLFQGWTDTMVKSYLGGCMGYGFVDDPENPTAAAIVVGDFALTAGKAHPALLDVAVQYRHCSTLLIVPGSQEWAGCIEARFGQACTSFQRYAIRQMPSFDRARLEQLASALPQGYRLQPIDATLYRRVMRTPWAEDFCALFRDEQDYLTRGLGVVALHGDELVAGASSYSVYPGGIEIEIDTREDCRRQGLATACGAWLMLEALRRDLYPNWDAANLQSVALAQKLGYVMDHPYRTYKVQF